MRQQAFLSYSDFISFGYIQGSRIAESHGRSIVQVFFFLTKNILKAERHRARDKDRHTERSSICCFIFQMTSMATAGSSWSLEPGAQTRSLTWVAVTQVFRLSPALSRVCISNKLELGTELTLRPKHFKWEGGSPKVHLQWSAKYLALCLWTPNCSS